jgi:2-aminoethylphosphonate-pyruvate transaminase
MIKTAVILAAGLGSRLNERTEHIPKGFLKIDNKTLIGMSINKLLNIGIEEIIIGTGYHKEWYDDLGKEIPQVKCVFNPVYATSGSMHTLYCLRDDISRDFLLLESDLLYEKSGLSLLMGSEDNNLILSSGFTGSEDEVFIEVNDNNRLLNMSKDRTTLTNIYSELVGITKLSLDFYKTMCVNYEALNKLKVEYEHMLVSTSKNKEIKVIKDENYIWCEIDTEEHYDRAKNTIYNLIQAKELA